MPANAEDKYEHKLHIKRMIAMCLSTKKSEYHQMLHDKMPCHSIYSKDFQEGTLYALLLKTQKTYITLNKAIVDLDSAISQGRRRTNFVSLNEVLSGKIKTFASGEHRSDEHYKAIFQSDYPGGGRTLRVHPGVRKWTPQGTPNNDLFEFDVVKKRRMMAQAPDDDASECPDALQRFEDFESHVLPALLKIDAEDKQTRRDEMLQMELDLCSGMRSLTGGVYVAVSKAVKFPKIGATRKGDPAPRLQALSRHVPSPFQAIYWVPTVMPFKVESEIHKHFDTFRLRERGACTEFFNVDVSAIGEYLKENYAVVETGAL